MKIENRSQCEEAVLNAVIATNQIWNLQMEIPSIGFFSKGKIGGLAYKFRHVVEFNEVLMKENPNDFVKTVVHEIAHLAMYKLYPNARQSHGPEFKFVFQSILNGMNVKAVATRCHSYDTTSVSRDKQYLYRCSGGCDHKVGAIIHRRIQQGQNRICRLTKGKITSNDFIN